MGDEVKLSDRELSALAGKAAGIKTYRAYGDVNLLNRGDVYDPLYDSDQAFELVVKLGLLLVVNEKDGHVADRAGTLYMPFQFTNDNELERFDIVRRAIVLIAAEQGKLL